jgi:electron transfer flavoprotein beta subunit
MTTQPTTPTGLHIVVCVKPVPDPAKWDKLKLDPDTLLLNRSQIPAVINPLDLNAIEMALTIKARVGGTVTVLSMAPAAAEEQLREALAMGCDRAILLSDRAFAGADSLATARCLAAAIGRIAPFDLVFCGGYSLDGSTAQVGPQLAELLDIPDLTHVTALELAEGGVRAETRVAGGSAAMSASLPLLCTFERDANEPRLAGMAGIGRAGAQAVECWGAADLGLAAGQVGLAGSPTQMLNVFTPPVGRKGDMLQGSVNDMAAMLVSKLRADKVLD